MRLLLLTILSIGLYVNNVDAAIAQQTPSLEGSSTVITVDAFHHFTVNGNAVTNKALIENLDRATDGDHNRTIIVRADKNAKYIWVDDLKKRLQKASYKQMMLQVQGANSDVR